MRDRIKCGEVGFAFEPYANNVDRTISQMVDTQKDLIEIVWKQMRYIHELHEHVGELYTLIFRIAPEIELIDCIAESEEDREMMMDLYLNRNESAVDDLEAYKVIVSDTLERVRSVEGLENICYDDIKGEASQRFRQERAAH